MALKKTEAKAAGSEKILVVVESPAKIKTISKFLGSNYKIVSTVGHIKDLPEKKIGVEINDKEIKIDYVPLKGKAKVISDICSEAKKADEILLASDPDREGEVISYHVEEEIRKGNKKAKIFRIVFNELTKTAVQAGIENKHEIDQQKVAAQQARRILDRWVGYEVSPVLWRKIVKGTSAGRVQSVAVLFICQREEEIKNFVAEESWTIHAVFLGKDFKLESQFYKLKGKAEKIKNEADAKKLLDIISKTASFAVSEIADKKRTKNPLAPFITSTLQQDAYNKLGFSVEKTMMLAQKLYEGVSLADGTQEALITYMRSDSTRLSDTALKEIKSFVKTKLGEEYLAEKTISYGKGAQDAHEAVRPISIDKTPESLKNQLDPDFLKLYDLIWRRTVACQMSPAIYAQRQVLISGGDVTFKSTGSTLIFEGFLKVYKPEEEGEEKEDVISEKLAQGMELGIQGVTPKQHFTQPPPRYTEASLIKELEKRGIGRPSTFVAIMTTIQKRNYVEKQAKRFVPTELGKAVVGFLVSNLKDIFNESFTRKMEEDLDKIASGEISRDETLFAFYKKLKDDLNSFLGKTGEEAPSLRAIKSDVVCPICKTNNLLIRFSKNGEYLACSGFPECKFTASFERDEDGKIVIIQREAAKALDKVCPNCGKNLVEKSGRFGKFAACPGYPDCKYIEKNYRPK